MENCRRGQNKLEDADPTSASCSRLAGCGGACLLVPAAPEAEAGEPLQARSWGPAWEAWRDPALEKVHRECQKCKGANLRAKRQRVFGLESSCSIL